MHRLILLFAVWLGLMVATSASAQLYLGLKADARYTPGLEQTWFGGPALIAVL